MSTGATRKMILLTWIEEALHHFIAKPRLHGKSYKCRIENSRDNSDSHSRDSEVVEGKLDSAESSA